MNSEKHSSLITLREINSIKTQKNNGYIMKTINTLLMLYIIVSFLFKIKYPGVCTINFFPTAFRSLDKNTLIKTYLTIIFEIRRLDKYHLLTIQEKEFNMVCFFSGMVQLTSSYVQNSLVTVFLGCNIKVHKIIDVLYQYKL